VPLNEPGNRDSDAIDSKVFRNSIAASCIPTRKREGLFGPLNDLTILQMRVVTSHMRPPGSEVIPLKLKHV
jgi:hypothetical protein